MHAEARKARRLARYHSDPEYRAKAAARAKKRDKAKLKAAYRAWYLKNKARRDKYTEEWQKNNPDKVKAMHKRRHIRHREKNNARTAAWREKNPEKLKAGQKRYFDNKLATDPVFRMRHRLRSHIRIILNKQGVIKSRKTLDLLGCTSQFWREYLEPQFLPGMSWDNYGTHWQIDHIIPLSKFDLSDVEQQKRAFNYSNTRPLWIEDNRDKSDTLPGPHQALLI